LRSQWKPGIIGAVAWSSTADTSLDMASDAWDRGPGHEQTDGLDGLLSDECIGRRPSRGS